MRASVHNYGQPSKKELAALVHDAEKSAAAVSLVHVTDKQPGISRIRKGKGFTYRDGRGTVRERSTLARIRSLAIPPAWNQVWICTLENGHLQATGTDARGRKQYRYHTRWSKVRGLTKFFHMVEFGKRLPTMRRQVAAHLRRKGMPREKVLAAVVAMMESTRIRVGNRAYEQSNGSFGLSTLKDRHLRGSGKATHLKFRGKSGVMHQIPIHSPMLRRVVMRCKELPGQELFQYLDEEGVVHDIDSGHVNTYFNEISGGHFTSKDMRTWMGTACFVKAVLEIGPAEGVTQCRTHVNQALDVVAASLGNTRAVCRSSYVDPRIIASYERNKLHEHAKRIRSSARIPLASHSHEEKVLMRVLKDKNA